MKFVDTVKFWATSQPDAIAHISQQKSMTYGELWKSALHLSRTLQQGDRSVPVVVRGHKECEMLIGFLGCMLARRPYVPIDTSLPTDRIEQILKTAATSDVLTPSSIAQFVTKASKENDNDLKQSYQSLTDDEPVYIMFTSGSTGTPKGVVISAGSLQDFIDWMVTEQKFSESTETFFDQAPFSFDLSVMELFLSLATGSTLFSITREEISNPAVMYRRLIEGNLTVWISTPSFAQMALRDESFSAKNFHRLKKFLFCGEPLLKETVNLLSRRFPTAEIWNTYGPTEATVATTSIQITAEIEDTYARLPIGYSKSTSQLRILDDQGNDVAAGERGEITIVGPNVGHGYFKRPDLTSAVFFERDGQRAYRTGDVGYSSDVDPTLFFCEGRKDFQVKFHGYRIELGDIEAHLRRNPEVKDAVVVPKLKEGKVEFLAACVIKESIDDQADQFEEIRSLKKFLAHTLPAYMVPQRYVFVESFPMTPNDKIDRKKLAELFS